MNRRENPFLVFTPPSQGADVDEYWVTIMDSVDVDDHWPCFIEFIDSQILLEDFNLRSAANLVARICLGSVHDRGERQKNRDLLACKKISIFVEKLAAKSGPNPDQSDFAALFTALRAHKRLRFDTELLSRVLYSKIRYIIDHVGVKSSLSEEFFIIIVNNIDCLAEFYDDLEYVDAKAVEEFVQENIDNRRDVSGVC
ncbi:MAG: hypothetical protein AAGA34_05960 [Pseudomonadota bacterium]